MSTHQLHAPSPAAQHLGTEDQCSALLTALRTCSDDLAVVCARLEIARREAGGGTYPLAAVHDQLAAHLAEVRALLAQLEQP